MPIGSFEMDRDHGLENALMASGKVGHRKCGPNYRKLKEEEQSKDGGQQKYHLKRRIN